MNQQDYIDRGDLASVEHALSILKGIEPTTSSVIEGNDFVGVEITLRTWRQELFKLMMTRIKKGALEKSNGSGRPDDTQKLKT